ncbi:TPA: hypothetical protein EYP26_02425 [Candidatus Bathyarchaeota archaeon]|nr:hypothetical protein [Candidatus Bathyarchaeota archaeon]
MFVGFSEIILILLVVLIIFILPTFLRSKRGREFKNRLKLYGAVALLVFLLLVFTKVVFTLFGVILSLFMLLLLAFFLLVRRGID